MSSGSYPNDAGWQSSSAPEGLTDHVTEFVKAAAEMAVEFGKGCRDIVRQSLVREDSYIGRTLVKGSSYVGRKVRWASEKLRMFNQYLPEDKDPLHAMAVIFFVCAIAFAGMFGVFAEEAGRGELRSLTSGYVSGWLPRKL
jgi:hypothetical protein